MKIDARYRKEIVRFLIAGIFVGAIDFGTYYILIRFLTYSIAKGISFTGAGIAAYLFNKYWIFSGTQLASYAEIGRYVIINFAALGINIIINQAVLNRWPQAVFFALISAAMLTGLFTFVGYKWWVFRPR